MTRPPIRLAILTTHPVQYAAPLFRRLAQEPDIDLTVLYESDISLRDYADPGFGRRVAWGLPLLEGYASQFLPRFGRSETVGVWHPFPRGLKRALRQGRYDWLFVHGYGRPAHILAAIIARLCGIKVLIRDEATAVSRSRGRLKNMVKQMFFRSLDRVVDGFLTIGTLNREYYRQHGVADDRLFAMPYAVENKRFAATSPTDGEAIRKRLNVGPDDYVILYASKLQARKHPDHLVDAFLRLSQNGLDRPAHLVVVGDGEMRDALERMAQGVPNVHFEGFRNQVELPAYYAMCDVFVLPSSHEPWGLVVNEAMNLGKPIIVSDQVGCGPDLVRHGVNGLVYPVGDVDALAKALGAIGADADAAMRMGQASLEIISAWDYEADVRGLRRAIGLG